MDPDVDTYDDRVYARALESFRSLLEKGVLQEDDEACLYLYRLTMDGRSQTGLVCCTSIDEYFENVIKKHEKTRPDKETDRIRHVDALSAHTGPIFLAYRRNDEIREVIESKQKVEPELSFVSDDGIEHAVWVIREKSHISELQELFLEVPHFYIADGHHRTASAAKVGQMRREKYPDYDGEEEFNFFLSVLFSEDELKIFDYNRLVKDTNGLSEEQLLTEIGKSFEVAAAGKDAFSPTCKGEYGMYLHGQWFRLWAKQDLQNDANPVASLDISILQERLLQPILGIGDPRTDSRIDFVGGIRGLKELERRVDSGEMQVAFSLYATSLQELFAVADANMLMPPKSTWFEPKLRSGLFVHTFEE